VSARRTQMFVQRRTYRRRRLADGARLLPVFGAALLLVPLLWQSGDPVAGAADTVPAGQRSAWVMTYLFLVWLGLVVLSGILSRHLAADDESGDDDGGR